MSLIQLLVALLLMSVMTFGESYHVVMPSLPDESYSLLGDLNIGVLVPVHHHSKNSFCSDKVRVLSVLQRVEAVRFAIDEINNRTDILPDHKLGFIMFDDCYKGITALAQSLHFIQQSGEGECLAEENVPAYCYNESITTHEVVGIIGSESSQTTVQMANLYSSFEMPQISYLATGSVLSKSFSYPYFKRTVPSDKLQAKVIVSLLKHFNWSYVSVVHMEGEYGTKGFQDLHEVGNPTGVCFAAVLEIRRDFRVSDYTYTVYKVLQENKAKVVIVIAPLFQARQLLAAAKRLEVNGRITWIASDAWARNIIDVVDYEKTALGMLSVNILSSNVERFDKHFQSIRADTQTGNPWLSEFYERYHDCVTTPNSGKQVCDPSLRISDHKNYIPDSIVSLVFDSVYAFARGLHAAVESPACSHLNKQGAIKCARRQLKYHLNDMNFTGEFGQVAFDEKGDVARDYIVYNLQNTSSGYKFVHMTTWRHGSDNLTFTGNSIQWSKGEQPPSFCSSLCGVGEQTVLQQKRCCWVCEPCAEDQYTRESFGRTQQRCTSCQNGSWPDPVTRSKCNPIEPEYLKWYDVLGIMLGSITSAGLAACIVTATVFILNKNDPLIKASSRELSYFMMAGVITNYSVVFCFLMRPNDTVCLIRFLGISICFTFLYAPLVTKTVRIYRIFNAGSRMNRRPTCVSSVSQIGIAVNVLLFHICIIVGWAVVERPISEEIHSSRKIVELVCHFPLGPLVTSLTYNGALVLASVYFAFKTRKLPGNYNESKFISFCVYSTVVIWCAFVPAYFAVGKAFFEVMFLSLVVLSNATLILCCIFLPKVYALYFVDKDDLQVSPQFTKQKGTRRLIEEVSASTNSDIKPPEKSPEKSPSTGTLDKIKEAPEPTTTTTTTTATVTTTETEDAATSTDFPYPSSMVHVSPAPTTHASPVDLWF